MPGNRLPEPCVLGVPEEYVFGRCSNLPEPAIVPALEEWSIQGYYRNTASLRRDFLCSFFRFTPPGEAEGAPLFHLLVSEQDPVTGENRATSLADPGIREWITGIRPCDGDPGLYRAYIDELRESGVVAPVVTGPPGPAVLEDPFLLSWGSFSLAATATGTLLTVPRPGNGELCRFSLRPVSPAWYYVPAGGAGDRGMACAAIPRLRLDGTVDGAEVTGEVWAEHRWASNGWFSSPGNDGGANAGAAGWDCYRICLDSGPDLMVFNPWNMGAGGAGRPGAVIRDGSCIYGTSAVSVNPLGSWVGPVTGIRYPISAQLLLPNSGAELILSPVAENQELALPGPDRAVWDGTADVTGTFRGEPVHGRARARLCGHDDRPDFEKMVFRISRQIDREIARFFPDKGGGDATARFIGNPEWTYESRVYPDIIAGPVWDLMNRGGKHYRPIYAVLLLHSLGVDPAPYFDLLALIPELNHTGALIVDDIEDNSAIRRGGASIHISHGIDVAINAANTLYYLPWLLVENHPRLDDRQRLLLYESMVKCAVKAHFGQGMDLFWSRKKEPAETLAWLEHDLAGKILQMHADKTGVAGEQIASICCAIARVPDPVRKSCLQYSRDLWIAFQIMDDIRDISGGPGWKKQTGQDIAGGKLNYVIVRALGLLDIGEREDLARILALAPAGKNGQLVRDGIGLVLSSGAVPICAEEAAGMLERGWSAFSPGIPASDAKVLLRAFSREMIRY